MKRIRIIKKLYNSHNKFKFLDFEIFEKIEKSEKIDIFQILNIPDPQFYILMNNRFRTGKYKGPIYKLKTKHIQFDEDKDREDVEKMFTRKREIGQPGSSTLGPIVLDKSKRNKRNAPKVENKYLAESL